MNQRIPVLDLGPFVERGRLHGQRAATEAIAEACRDWGFFQITNHGVPAELIQRVWRETHGFFALPRESKLAISRTAENSRGYYDRELTKQVRDLKEVFDFAGVPHRDLPDDHPRNRAAVDGFNQWPASLPTFRATLLDYFEACERLGFRIMEGMCLGLGVPADILHPHFRGNHTSFARLNHYPLEDPLEPAAAAAVTDLGNMALHHHTDAGVLTILLQDDVGGLQVFAGNEWLDVEPIDGALVVNIGDMMQVWSNDLYHAALHRVRPVQDRPRFSIPFFFNPSYATDCVPLPALSVHGARFRAVRWGTFRERRTAGDYADYGREIQISDYRTDKPRSGEESP